MAKRIEANRTNIGRIVARLRKLGEQVEAMVNAPIPGTGRMPFQGARVIYMTMPGTKKDLIYKRARRANLSARATEVLNYLIKQREASSAALQAGLKVNRNVIAGAIHELKQAGIVTAQSLNNEGAQIAYGPRRSRS